MEESVPLPLTPEQIAAFAAIGGVVHAEDPVTKRRYVLIDDAPERLTIDELRAMIQEGLDSLDRGEGVPWDPESIKAELRELCRQRGAS